MKPINIIILTTLFIVLALLLWIMFVEIRSEGAQCTLDPVKYGLDKMARENQVPISCNCWTVGFVTESISFHGDPQN